MQSHTRHARTDCRLLLAILALALGACGADRLTGVAAQEAARQYQSQYADSDTGPIIFIDGEEIPSPIALRTDPSTIDSVVVLRGAAAKAAYGERGRHGVILIYLKPTPVKPLANDAWWLAAVQGSGGGAAALF